MAPIVGSWFSDRAHYNEFVKNGSKSWALMRRWLVSEVKNYTEPNGPTSQGERTPRPRTGTPNSFCIPGASLISLGLLLLPCPPALGDLCCYIFLFSVHPSPTLVSHPCPYSSAHLIGHSFWCFVSCCGPHCTVQGSHPYQ